MKESETTEIRDAPDIRDRASAPANRPEPRWPALVAVLAAGGLYAALPPYLAVGPQWLLLAVAGAFAAGAVLSYRRGYHAANVVLGHAQSAVLTAFLLWSVVLLVSALPGHKEPPV